MMHNVIIKDNKYFDINPMQFGHEDCAPSHHFGPAIRTYWLIHFVVSGCGVYKIKNKTYNIQAGEMFVIPPNVETYYEADATTPWEYIWVGFTSNSDITQYLADVTICPEAEKIFQQMKNCEKYSEGRSMYLSARLWDLFVLLSEKTDAKNNDYVQKALDCIHSEYMYDITISELSQRLNLDRTYFSVIFKNKLNISPKKYLLNYRMNIAASLLSKGNTNISVIAYSVGYSDLYVFSKMFKRHFGVSPTAYAKLNLS
jgi:AraC-like DNA-binding protein